MLVDRFTRWEGRSAWCRGGKLSFSNVLNFELQSPLCWLRLLLLLSWCGTHVLCRDVQVHWPLQLGRSNQSETTSNLPKSLLWNEEIELEHFTRGSSKMVLKMVVISLVTNASTVYAFQCWNMEWWSQMKKCLYMKAILNWRIGPFTNEEFSIIICSQVSELCWRQANKWLVLLNNLGY